MKILVISDDYSFLEHLEGMLNRSAPEQDLIVIKHSLQETYKLNMIPDMADVVIFGILQEETDDLGINHIIKTYSAFFPVVVIVDYDKEDFWQWILKIGAQDYLVKDQFSEWVLFKSVRRAVYQKNINDQLKESQRSHVTLLGNLPGLVYRCLNDPDWTMEFVSQGCFELTGYQPESLMDNRDLAYAELILDEDQDYVWEEIQKALKERRHFEIDYRIRTAEGKIKFVREKGVGVFSESGNLTMLEGFIIDVSHKIKAQQELSRSENRFRSLVHSVDDIVFRVGKDRKISGVFGTWAEKIGFHLEELMGLDVCDFFDRAKVRINPEVFNFVLKGKHQSFEWKMNLKGVVLDYSISLSPLQDENGEIYGLVCVGRDISRLKQIENELRDSKVLAQSIADSLSENICVIDSDGEIIAVNTAWKKNNHGVKNKLDVGDKFFSTFAEVLGIESDKQNKVKNGVKAVLNGEKEQFLIEYLAYSDEENKWFQLRAFPLLNHRTGAVIMQSSISERKRYELEQSASIAIYAAMRTSLDRETLIKTILTEISRLLDSDSVAIVTYDETNEILFVENAIGTWYEFLGRKIPCSPKSVCSYVMENGVSYILEKDKLDTIPYKIDFDFEVKYLFCIPMVVSQERLGVIWVGRDRKFSQPEISQMENISVLAAASIRQLNLFEQTLQRLQHLNALRKIDQTILSSLDRKIILDTILRQVLGLSEKGSLAVDILVYNSGLSRLEFLAGDGFNYANLENVWFVPDSKMVPLSFIKKEMIVLKDLSVESDFIKRRGFELENFRVYYSVPMIAKGKLVGALEIFSRKAEGLDQEILEFLSSIADQTSIALNSIEMFEDLRSKNLELIISYDTTIEAWSRTLDLRHKDTSEHTNRVTQLAVDLARKMGFKESELIHVQRGALLHDIGKICIPDDIMYKPGPLDEEEWEIVRQHPVAAFNLLSPVQFLKEALDIPYYHHEKWDGSGYPHGFSGEQIPLAARLFAVIDVWDSLTSDRPFRKAWSKEKTLEYIRSQTGLHFDPRVVDAFIDLIKENDNNGYGSEF